MQGCTLVDPIDTDRSVAPLDATTYGLASSPYPLVARHSNVNCTQEQPAANTNMRALRLGPPVRALAHFRLAFVVLPVVGLAGLMIGHFWTHSLRQHGHTACTPTSCVVPVRPPASTLLRYWVKSKFNALRSPATHRGAAYDIAKNGPVVLATGEECSGLGFR